MVRMRQMRMVSYIAVLLLVAMYIAPTACIAKGEKKLPPPPSKAMLVFPFEDNAQSPIEGLPLELANSIQNGLSAAGAYQTFVFSDQIPSIRRAVMETTLKADDLRGPFGTEQSQITGAVKIAKEMAADLILVGSIDEVTSDPANKKAQVTLTAVVADGRTGEAIKTLAVTGETPANTDSTIETDLIAMAAGDAVAKLVKEVSPEPVVPVKPVVEKKKKTSLFRRLVVPLLLGAAVGLIIGSSGGSSNDAIDNPPVNPF